MSHTVAVKCAFRDLDALDQAVAAFGATLVRDQRQFRMYGSETESCIHAITIPGTTYEVGLRYANAHDQSTFDASCDFFDGSIKRAFGDDLVGLKNEYLAVVAENQLRANGYWVERQTVDNRIYLTAQA